MHIMSISSTCFSCLYLLFCLSWETVEQPPPHGQRSWSPDHERRIHPPVKKYVPLAWKGTVPQDVVCLRGEMWIPFSFHIAKLRDYVLGRVMGGKTDSWNWEGTKYGIESAMSHNIFIFKVGIDLVLGSSLPLPRLTRNQSCGIDAWGP